MVAMPVDSPVRMLSLHSNPATSSSRTSAGTTSPSASRTTSPGTSVVTSTAAKRPSRHAMTVYLRLECSRAAVFSARYSLTKPNPMLASRMMPMMTAWVLSPRKYDSTAVPANRTSSALRSWRPRMTSALTACVLTALGPWIAKRAAASVLDSPSTEASSQVSTSLVDAEATRAAALDDGVFGAKGATAPPVDAFTVPGRRRRGFERSAPRRN